MQYYFSNKKLLDLYETGQNKKYKLEKNIITEFIWLVSVIDAAKNIHDFWGQPSLNFEKLQGFKTRYSFRLTRKYRLEVDIEWEDKEQKVGIVGIDEISKHYQ
ncbi:MAG: type II toxin-antitoxin system RelE/ParE family toxin [Spirochaetales bacterium]|nr:type II toxin-antitoxin system RelE/ParE family toxin [Spirochaetales bacterium]